MFVIMKAISNLLVLLLWVISNVILQNFPVFLFIYLGAKSYLSLHLLILACGFTTKEKNLDPVSCSVFKEYVVYIMYILKTYYNS